MGFEVDEKTDLNYWYYTAYELFDNGSELRNVITKKTEKKVRKGRLGCLTEFKARNYFKQMVSGYLEAYNLKTLHRDLKPENIWVTDNGQIKILDFGFAKRAQEGQKKIKATSFVGTYNYMANEVFWSEEYDFKADLFSLGVILYEMLVGKVPNRGQNNHIILDFGAVKLSDRAKNLIENLLLPNATLRITMEELVVHKFLTAPISIFEQSIHSLNKRMRDLDQVYVALVEKSNDYPEY